MTEIKAACQSTYHPKKQLSIDDWMVATKPRTGMNQYIHVHVAYDGDTVKRKLKKGDESWEETKIPVPKPIVDYNMYMGGVVLCDQLIQYYSVHHTTRRWSRTMFFFFFFILLTLLCDQWLSNVERTSKAEEHTSQPAHRSSPTGPTWSSLWLSCLYRGELDIQYTPVPISQPVARLRCEKCKVDGLPRKYTSWKCNDSQGATTVAERAHRAAT